MQTLFILAVILTALCPLTLAGAPRSIGPTDPAELEAFFDNYLTAQMSAHHVAGAMVAVVKDGQVLFTKGYGYADIAKKTPVDPEKTMFVLGSLTKLFTWTAVMQLVEQGKLDLNTDIHTYLDFKIPATFAEPITLNHLMAHTAGFEDNKFGQMAAVPEGLIPLGEWLKTHIPTRVRAPGLLSAYANYGAALAGYIVERVSAMPFDQYIEKNILIPLGMTHTTSRQPLPAALRADLSPGYIFAKGAYQAQPAVFEAVLHPAPAGSIHADAGDMARFMIAHLNDGRYAEAVILQPATARLMHTRSFSHDPRVNGMAHGFWELDMNGRRIIGHIGSHFTFNSMMLLFPEDKLGVFMATNSQGGGNFIGENYFPFYQAFVRHYFPIAVPALTPPVDFAQRAGRFSGNYSFTFGRSDTTPEKLFGLIMAVNIQADQDGLSVRLPFGKERFVEIGPMTFRQKDGDTLLVFHEDGTGVITQCFYGPAPLTALVKNRWFETPKLHLILLAMCIILFLSFLIIAPIAFLVHRKRVDRKSAPLPARPAQWVAGITSLLSLLLLFGVFGSLFNIIGLFTGHLPLWKGVPAGSMAVGLLALAMIAFTFLGWKRHYWSLAGRIHYTLVTLAAVALTWFLYFWNILGRSF